MKKLFTLFLAFVASAGTLFADGMKIGNLFYNLDFENQTAIVIGIDTGYYGDLIIPDSVSTDSSEVSDVPWVPSPAEGYVTFVIEIPEGSECHGIAFKGTLDGTTWTGANQYMGEYGPTNVDDCIRFELINGTTNWYKATFRLGNQEYIQGKICLIYSNDGSWEGQAAYWSINNDYTTADYDESGTGDLVVNSSGLIYLHINGWRFTECPPMYEYNITVLTPEFCGEEFPIELVGDFEGWGTNPAPLTKVSNGVYSATIQAYVYCSIKVRGQGSWDREIQILDPENGWYGVHDVFLPEDTNVVIDYTDVSLYRWNICGEDEENNMYAPKMNISNKPFLSTTNERAFKVTGIGNRAFERCEGLTSITIPNSVTSIGEWAFSACYGLTSLTIPNSVDTIGSGLIANCFNIASIVVEPGNTRYDSRDNCNAIIDKNLNELISGCKNTIIPNSVMSIGEWSFYGCRNLTSITIPNSVTNIGELAFIFCSSLTSIIIPDGVNIIGGGAFMSCGNISSVTCHAEIPPTINTDTGIGYYYPVFNGLNCAITPLYVPEQSVEAYKAADQWKDFNVKAIGTEEDALPKILTYENVQDGKFMIDGVLYIRKDGRVYDIIGQEMH